MSAEWLLFHPVHLSLDSLMTFYGWGRFSCFGVVLVCLLGFLFCWLAWFGSLVTPSGHLALIDAHVKSCAVFAAFRTSSDLHRVCNRHFLEKKNVAKSLKGRG